MTNLEFYKDEIKEKLSNNTFISDCVYQVYVKHYDFHTRNTEDWLFDWLLEEHRELIKLKQWEHDFLFYLCSIGSKNRTFKNYDVIEYFYVKGYFKGIVDTSMTLQEILDNCEIVADDYEWEE